MCSNLHGHLIERPKGLTDRYNAKNCARYENILFHSRGLQNDWLDDTPLSKRCLKRQRYVKCKALRALHRASPPATELKCKGRSALPAASPTVLAPVLGSEASRAAQGIFDAEPPRRCFCRAEPYSPGSMPLCRPTLNGRNGPGISRPPNAPLDGSNVFPSACHATSLVVISGRLPTD